MRNCSLVEESRAENETGLKSITEAAALTSCQGVGERSQGAEAEDVSHSGALGSENAGMSSDNPGENPGHRKPKVSYATLIGVG